MVSRESLYPRILGPQLWASPFPSSGRAVLSNTRELDVWASPSTPLLRSLLYPVTLFTLIQLSNPLLVELGLIVRNCFLPLS